MEDRVLNPQATFPECLVLYVEDDDATAYLFQRALVESGTRVHVFRVGDGAEAISFLIRHGLYRDVPIPDLVVLDIGLPKKTGFDVLESIRSEERLKDVAVVMLTASISLRDRQKALRLGARDFFAKSSDWHEIIATGKSVCDLALNPDARRNQVSYRLNHPMSTIAHVRARFLFAAADRIGVAGWLVASPYQSGVCARQPESRFVDTRVSRWDTEHDGCWSPPLNVPPGTDDSYECCTRRRHR